MDKRELLKQVGTYISNGKFRQATEFINNVKLNNEIGLNIIIRIANVCYDKSSELQNEDFKDICHLLKYVLLHISTLKGSYLDSYLKSAFHITKVLVEKESYEHLSAIEFMILPLFLNDFQDSKHIYQQIISKLSHSIYHLAKTKDTSRNKHVLDITNLILKSSTKISDDTITLARKLFCNICCLKFKSYDLKLFYLMVLKMFRSKTSFSIDELVILIEIFSQIFTTFIKERAFKAAEELLNDIGTCTSCELFIDCHMIFQIITGLFPKKLNNVSNHINIELLMNTHLELKYRILPFLEEPLRVLLTYYETDGLQTWCLLPSNKIGTCLAIFQNSIFNYWFNKSDSSKSDINEKYNIIMKVAWHIHKLILSNIEQHKDSSEEIFHSIRNWFIYCYSLIGEMKNNNCEKWIGHYKVVNSYTHNIGVELYNQSNAAYILFYEEFIQRFIQFEDLPEKIIKASLIEKAFYVICEMHSKKGDILSCMAFAALHCLLYLDTSSNIFFVWWIKSKANARQDSKIQSHTLVTCLYAQEEVLKKIIDPTIYLTNDKKIELLIFELTNYKNLYKSKTPMMETFCQLIEIADLLTIANVISKIFGDGDVVLHDKMASTFFDLMERIEEGARTTQKPIYIMALAVLRYYHYKTVCREAAKKSMEEVDKNQLVVESAKEKFDPVPEDPNDECDVVTAYANLTLNTFLEVLNYLVKALDGLCNIFEENSESLELDILRNCVKLSIKIGYEFRIQYYELNYLRAFELGFKIAEKTSDNESQLLCIAFLIESANTSKALVSKFISQADTLIATMEKCNEKNKYNKVMAMYYIAKTKAYLHNNVDVAYESWKKANSVLGADKDNDEIGFLQVELNILDFKLTRACNFVVGDHARNPMTTKLHCAFDLVCDLSKNDDVSMGTYERCVLLDTVYELTKAYLLKRLPRDLRCYSKNSLVLTQKMMLPMRCVSFLTLLAYCDLLTCQIDNCSVKLNGIKDIFCIEKSALCDALDDEIEQVRSGVQQLTVEGPQSSGQLSPLLNYLSEENFKLPEFLYHREDCLCFFCMSCEYHKFLIQKFHLDALLHMYKGNGNLADNFIKGTLKFYDRLKTNYPNYIKKAQKLISIDLIPNFEEYFLECYGNVLFDYSYHLRRCLNNSEALAVNTRLIQLLMPKKIEFANLYCETLLQRYSYTTPISPIKPRHRSNRDLSPVVNIGNALAVTPENKTSTITVQLNSSYKVSPPKQRIKTKTTLFKSPSESELKLIPSPIHSMNLKQNTTKKEVDNDGSIHFQIPKAKEKRGGIQLFSTPKSVHIQTPKINIFTEDESPSTLRKTRKKPQSSSKKQSGDVQTTSVKKVTRSKKNVNHDNEESNRKLQENKHQMQTAEIPKSSSRTRSRVNTKLTELNDQSDTISSKPKVFDSDKNGCVSDSPERNFMSTRSKVLLEKIKTSAVKKQDEAGASKTNVTGTKPKVQKKLVRQLLLH